MESTHDEWKARTTLPPCVVHHLKWHVPSTCITLAKPSALDYRRASSVSQPMRSYMESGQRLTLLDALRGLASLSVAVFHIYSFSGVGAHLAEIAPNWLDAVFKHGGLGVDVFFVISGIAIAASVGSAPITWRYIGRFALRRSIRLDPPYWATLALASVILALDGRAPSMGRVLVHVFYAQTIVGQAQIVSVFWTLTYEVQFYLVFVLAVMFGQRFGTRAGWALAIVPFLTSLAVPALHVDAHGLFILWWYAFAAGAATFGMLKKRLPLAVWLVALALIAADEAFVGSLNHIAVAVAALSIGLVGRAGLLSRWTGGRVLQWLGSRSYSLYLIHFLGAAIAKILSPRIGGPGLATLVFAGSLLVALAAAEVVHRLIEAPAHRLSRTVNVLFAERSVSEPPTLSPEPTQDASIA